MITALSESERRTMAGPRQDRELVEVLHYQHDDWELPVARHVHNDVHEIVVIAGGEYAGEVDHGLMSGQPGDMVFYPKRHWHHPKWKDDDPRTSFYVVRWRGSCAPLSGDEPVMRRDKEGRVTTLTRWLREGFLLPDGQSHRDELLGSLLFALLFEFDRCDPSPTDDMVNRVRRYIHDNLREKLTLDMLAEVAGLSRFHFTRLFRKATGQPPMTYLRQQRVEAARVYLTTTNAPLKAIAPAVGFADEQQLSRVFRRVTGEPPGAVRRGVGE